MAQPNSNPFQRHILAQLILSANLSNREAYDFFQLLVTESVDPSVARSAVILLREKRESAREIVNAVSIIRSKGKHYRCNLPYLVDNCGTGGDSKNTFNISTIASFVAAGGGAHVAKHGNRSVSSRVGSSDLMESLGVNIEAEPHRMLSALRDAGIGYFHAPLYHPSMGAVRPLRNSIPGRTIFNLLGPLLNPVDVKRQVIGVPDANSMESLADALEVMRVEKAVLLLGMNGMDEATPYGRTIGLEIERGKKCPFTLVPSNLGFRRASEIELRGGTIRENRAIALGILQNRLNGPKTDAVILNAGIALYSSGRAKNVRTGIEMARMSLESGAALRALLALRKISNC